MKQIQIYIYIYVCLYTDILEDCWTGWKGFRKSCYKIFINSSLSKKQAEYQCAEYGGHLVSISSKEEMEFVHELIIINRIQDIFMIDAIFIGMLVYQKFKNHAQANEQFLATTKLATNKAICHKAKKKEE
jgi:hypothetical protein